MEARMSRFLPSSRVQALVISTLFLFILSSCGSEEGEPGCELAWDCEPEQYCFHLFEQDTSENAQPGALVAARGVCLEVPAECGIPADCNCEALWEPCPLGWTRACSPGADSLDNPSVNCD